MSRYVLSVNDPAAPRGMVFLVLSKKRWSVDSRFFSMNRAPLRMSLYPPRSSRWQLAQWVVYSVFPRAACTSEYTPCQTVAAGVDGPVDCAAAVALKTRTKGMHHFITCNWARPSPVH